MRNSKSIFLSSLKMGIATLMSRILGLVREQCIAFTFGASSMTDAFYIAFRVPNMLRDLLAEGALSAAFVPNFIEAKGKSIQDAKKLLWSLFCFIFLITLSLSVLIVLFAPEIITFMAPSFKTIPEKFELTVSLTKIMAPFLIFVSVAALFMGALNSMGVFFIPSLSPAFFNISMILSILLIPAYFKEQGIAPIYSLGCGVIIGGLIQALFQIPWLIKFKLGPHLFFKKKAGESLLHEKTKKIIFLLGPGLLGFAATQINLIVNTILATSAITGAVSFLSYGFRLFQLPVGILSVSIGNSNLVHFSDKWKKNLKNEAFTYIKTSTHLSWVLIIPATLIATVFSKEIVHLIFERGEFSTYSTQMTAKALFWYALGLPFYGLYKVFVPAFYTIEKQMVPVYISIASIIFNIIFCTTFIGRYGFEVLALGTTLSMFLNSTLLIILFSKITNFSLRDLYSFRILKFIIGGGLTFLIIEFLRPHFSFYGKHLLYKGYYLVFASSSVFIIYAIFLFLFGEKEVVLKAASKIFSKFRPKR